MNEVLTWVRQNVFIVVFSAIILVAAIGGPLVSMRISEGVQERLDQRSRKFGELTQLERTQVVNPATGESVATVVNDRLLTSYRDVVGKQAEDAERVRRLALEHNRGNFSLILPDGWDDSVVYLFPEPSMRSVLEHRPDEFHRLLLHRYTQILLAVGAGWPPSVSDIAADIQRAESQFRLTQLFKSETDELSSEEREQLRSHLQQVRLGRYTDTARSISFYAAWQDLMIPGFDPRNLPSLARMFVWQWDYWITKDLLEALAIANAESRSVLDGPVKRLKWLRIYDDPIEAGGSSSGVGGQQAGFGSLGAGGATAPGRGPKPPDAPMAGVAADPKAPVPVDYTRSLTGRKSNALYDVRRVGMRLIVDAERLPAVLDSIAQQNFYTILDMQLYEADPFADAKLGYIYGPDRVMEVQLIIETIWFREWTKQFMPTDLKRTLGIPEPQPEMPEQPFT